MRTSSLLYLLIISVLSTALYAQKVERGRPFFRYYPPKEYSAGTQNWCFAQSESGLLYFGNNAGLLEYDGANWKTHSIPGASTIRSLSIDEEEKIIYIGAQSEFGYFTAEPGGKLVYTSLVEEIQESELAFNDVWGTVVTPGGAFFSSNEALFYWNGDKLKTWKAPSEKLFDRRIFYVHDRLFINQQKVGLLELRGFTLEPVVGLEDLGTKRLAFVLPASKRRLLIGTREGEVFFWDESRPKGERKMPFAKEWHKLFKSDYLYRGTVSESGKYVFSLITGGAFVIGEDGKNPDILKEQFGVESSVYFAGTDRENDLWICLNKGIIKADYASALTRWDKETGLEGHPVTTIRHKGQIYTTTGNSLYRLNAKNTFERIGNKGQQTWDALSFSIPERAEPFLWFADNSGLYEVRGNQIVNVAGVRDNTNNLIQDRNDPHLIYVASNKGVKVLKYESGRWRVNKDIPVESLVRKIVQADDGSIWAGTYNSGYIHIQDPLSENPSTTVYNDDKYGISPDDLHECYVWHVGGELLFTNRAGVFTWNGEQFLPDPRFDDYFKFASSKHIFYVGQQQNYIWVSGYNSRSTPIARAQMMPDGSWEWQLVSDLQRLPESLENFLFLEPSGKVWVNNSEGVFLFNPQEEKEEHPLPSVFIREVRANDSLIYEGNGLATEIQKKVRVPAEDNSLMFRYALPFFENEQGNQYQYQLSGIDEGWSEWTTDTKKEYINLFEGEYTFRVRARNVFNQTSEESYYTFRVLPPPYRTWWAYALYILLLGGLIWLIIRGNTQRVRRKNRMLEEMVAERTHKIQEQTGELRQQKEEIEKAYENVKILSEIGQQITAELQTEALIKRVYENVNNLMEAEAFGIGVINQERQQLEFRGFIEKGEELPFSADRLVDKDSLAVVCYKNQQEILLNDFETESDQYLKNQPPKVRAGEKPSSLIYLPLVVQEVSLGVLTVQSFRTNAYSERDITFLRTLASYVSIAISNARMYGNIQTENRRTTDSLRYAQTIQNAILPPEQELNQLGRDHFVIYRPRDIVSGDFYWALETDGYWFVAVVDCTGHGVPGAFMSMIGHSMLNEIINERHVLEPVRILEELNRELRIALRQEDGANEDGMDISLCRLENQIITDEVVLTFAGAGQSLFYHDTTQEELKQLRGEHKSIGGRQRSKRPFRQHEIKLPPHSTFYIYSDGIVDQNDPEGKKFGTRKLERLLRQVAPLEMSLQFTAVNKALNEHQQEMEQRDDITLLAIEV